MWVFEPSAVVTIGLICVEPVWPFNVGAEEDSA